MALEFHPYPIPEEKVVQHPVAEASQGIQKALMMYMQLKDTKRKQDMADLQTKIELAKARGEYGEDFDKALQSLGATIPGSAAKTSTPAATRSFVPTVAQNPLGGMQSAMGTKAPAENPYASFEDPYSALPGMGAQPTPAMPTAAAPAPVAGPAVGPTVGAAPAPSASPFKSFTDITPESLSEIRKKSGRAGEKRAMEQGTFFQNQAQNKAQISQYTIGNEGKMRDDYTNATRNFKTVSEQIQTIQSIANRPPTAAGDVSLIFSYMKLMDPNSSVREGEYANAANAAGIPDRLRALYNKLQTGEKLAPAQREDFIRTSGSLYQGWADKQKAVDDQFRGIATRSGANPDNVVVNFGVPNVNLSNYSSGAAMGQPGATPDPTARPAPPPTPEVQAKIAQAEQWLAANPNSPKAAQVRARLAHIKG
jgi:hypothetical protein